MGGWLAGWEQGAKVLYQTYIEKWLLENEEAIDEKLGWIGEFGLDYKQKSALRKRLTSRSLSSGRLYFLSHPCCCFRARAHPRPLPLFSDSLRVCVLVCVLVRVCLCVCARARERESVRSCVVYFCGVCLHCPLCDSPPVRLQVCAASPRGRARKTPTHLSVVCVCVSPSVCVCVCLPVPVSPLVRWLCF